MRASNKYCMTAQIVYQQRRISIDRRTRQRARPQLHRLYELEEVRVPAVAALRLQGEVAHPGDRQRLLPLPAARDLQSSGGWKCAIVGVPWQGSASAYLAWDVLFENNIIKQVLKRLSLLRHHGTPMMARLQLPETSPARRQVRAVRGDCRAGLGTVGYPVSWGARVARTDRLHDTTKPCAFVT